MTFHEIVMLALISLPFAVIGFFGGMLFMKAQYKWRLQQAHRTNRRLERRLYGCN